MWPNGKSMLGGFSIGWAGIEKAKLA